MTCSNNREVRTDTSFSGRPGTLTSVFRGFPLLLSSNYWDNTSTLKQVTDTPFHIYSNSTSKTSCYSTMYINMSSWGASLNINMNFVKCLLVISSTLLVQHCFRSLSGCLRELPASAGLVSLPTCPDQFWDSSSLLFKWYWGQSYRSGKLIIFLSRNKFGKYIPYRNTNNIVMPSAFKCSKSALLDSYHFGHQKAAPQCPYHQSFCYHHS